jgi:hypothetical protein
MDFRFPQYSNQPMTILAVAQDAIRYCLDHPSEAQSVYFRNLGNGPAHAMLFFTEDRGLILGLSVEEGEADDIFRRLRDHSGSELGYVTFEEPPPATVGKFRQQALTRN